MKPEELTKDIQWHGECPDCKGRCYTQTGSYKSGCIECNGTGQRTRTATLEEIMEDYKRLRTLEEELVGLISESDGVNGLHLNGDLADWNWLIEEGWIGSIALTVNNGQLRVKDEAG